MKWGRGSTGGKSCRIAMRWLPGSVDLAGVAWSADGRPQMVMCESYRREAESGRGDKAQVLAQLATEKHLRNCKWSTLLTADDYHAMTMDAPAVQTNELKEALRWQIKDMIDYPPEEACLDVAHVPAGKAGSVSTSVFVFASRLKTIQALVQGFDAAGLSLDTIDVPEMALRNVAALGATPGRAHALLRVDEAGGILVIVGDGELLAFRRIAVTPAQCLETDEGVRAEMIERVSLELQRSFDNLDRQFSTYPLTRLVVFSPASQSLVESLSASLSVPVVAGNLAELVDISKFPELNDPARQASCLASLGLALRDRPAKLAMRQAA